MFNFHLPKIIELTFVDKNFIVPIKSTLKFRSISSAFENSPKFFRVELVRELHCLELMDDYFNIYDMPLIQAAE